MLQIASIVVAVLVVVVLLNGSGRMAIVESTPSSRIAIQLEFEKPWKASNIAPFTLASSGATTNVTWAMEGQNSLAFKLMGRFINVDTMVGKDFEAGLATLKATAERQA